MIRLKASSDRAGADRLRQDRADVLGRGATADRLRGRQQVEAQQALVMVDEKGAGLAQLAAPVAGEDAKARRGGLDIVALEGGRERPDARRRGHEGSADRSGGVWVQPCRNSPPLSGLTTTSTYPSATEVCSSRSARNRCAPSSAPTRDSASPRKCNSSGAGAPVASRCAARSAASVETASLVPTRCTVSPAGSVARKLPIAEAPTTASPA